MGDETAAFAAAGRYSVGNRNKLGELRVHSLARPRQDCCRNTGLRDRGNRAARLMNSS